MDAYIIIDFLLIVGIYLVGWLGRDAHKRIDKLGNSKTCDMEYEAMKYEVAKQHQENEAFRQRTDESLAKWAKETP